MTRKPKAVVYFHSNCFDGVGAASVAKFLLEKKDIATTCIPYTHGTPDGVAIPGWVGDTKGIKDEIYCVDFTPKKADVLRFKKTRATVTVLDHHISAIEKVNADPEYKSYFDHAVFDIERSGCGITWDYISVGQRRPLFVNLIEDRDLYRFRYPFTKELYHFLGTLEFDIEEFIKILKHSIDNIEDPLCLAEFLNKGMAIGKYYDSHIESLAREAFAGFFKIKDKIIPFYNVPYFYGSDLCNKIIVTRDVPYCGYFTISRERVRGGLRSAKGHDECHILCGHLGGGGHANASGFESSIEDFLGTHGLRIIDGVNGWLDPEITEKFQKKA